MILKKYLLAIGLMLSISLHSQEAPKLVVGIVVDQMTNDYLYRFSGKFQNDGFSRLINEGYYFPNTFYNYMRTSTGPGHASIYTGTTPSNHGIVENAWYDYKLGAPINCVGDAEKIKSPSNLIGSTITDMLSISSRGKSKVMGIGIKDRGAILPAGHSSDLSLWWDQESSKWTSSAYYGESLPEWLNSFEKDHPASSYMQTWDFWYAGKDATKRERYSSHNKFEESTGFAADASMPYDLKGLVEENGMGVIKYTPFGNTYTFDLAKSMLEGEKMGEDAQTDFLCISFSSTDYIGHRFGPYSDEVEDTYLRFDNEMAKFLYFLDEKVGSGNYILFITADHGVVPNVNYLKSQKFPAQSYSYTDLKTELEEAILTELKLQNVILGIENDQVYLNKDDLNNKKYNELTRFISDYLNSLENIRLSLTSHDLLYKEYHSSPAKEMQNSFMKGRSGDVLFTWNPFMRSDEYAKGTGHGTGYVYDRNVPLIWYGAGIKKGYSTENVDISQISATLADLLQIQRPPFCTAESLFGKISR